jgi:hypothetical protein
MERFQLGRKTATILATGAVAALGGSMAFAVTNDGVDGDSTQQRSHPAEHSTQQRTHPAKHTTQQRSHSAEHAAQRRHSAEHSARQRSHPAKHHSAQQL